MLSRRRRLGLPRHLSLLFLGVWAVSCAGYAGNVRDMRHALHADNPGTAIDMVNRNLRVPDADKYPKKMGSTQSLLLLERAALLQGIGEYQASAMNFRVAERHMEMLDVRRMPVGNISQWIFSGQSGIYRAPFYEKLMLSVLNMLNYLAIGDLENARVAARRFYLTQSYLRDIGAARDAHLPFGSYLAGFVFEQSGRYEEALQFYEEALRRRTFVGLPQVMINIAGCTTYRTSRLNELLSLDPDVPAASACQQNAPPGYGTILVVPAMGLAPHKVARRVPIGAAIVLAGVFLAPEVAANANTLALKGLLKWVNFPELVQAPPAFDTVSVQVNDALAPVEMGVDVSAQAVRAWQQVQGKLMAAAIVRMISRALAGEATAHAVDSGSSTSGFGLLAQLLVEGAMTAADTPDTRSWNALPAGLFVSRAVVPAGTHRVVVRFSGRSGTHTVAMDATVRSGGFAVLPLFTLR
ncbi:MAG: tetratricopeptide repeat protein [Myxococcales bacterium]|jgi:tetratricopeptide (TPR) repeat protein|nr:tetratricopeptide repeat protein [Myxococcales bacterium]